MVGGGYPSPLFFVEKLDGEGEMIAQRKKFGYNL